MVNLFKLYKTWRNYRRIKAGYKTVDFKRGCGYYITGGWFASTFKELQIGDIVPMQMKSGLVGMYELLDYKNYNDPSDMTEWSTWHFVGYQGRNRIKDYTFTQYRNHCEI